MESMVVLMAIAGVFLAPSAAAGYLIVDHIAPPGTVTEATTWVDDGERGRRRARRRRRRTRRSGDERARRARRRLRGTGARDPDRRPPPPQPCPAGTSGGRPAAAHRVVRAAAPQRQRPLSATGRRPAPTRADGRCRRTRQPMRCSPRCRTSSTRVSSTSAPHSAHCWSSRVGDGCSASTPASQCGPCIAHGTTCSSRQKTANRSPASSAARKPSPGATATPHQLQRSCDTLGAYLLQDLLHLPWPAFPVLAAFPGVPRAASHHSVGSIRRPGYLHEHMFPFRPSNVAAGLLEIADALLAPSPPGSCADGGAELAATARSLAHPHRRPLVPSARRRRPATPAPLQPCLTPLARPAGRAQTPPPPPASVVDAAS